MKKRLTSALLTGLMIFALSAGLVAKPENTITGKIIDKEAKGNLSFATVIVTDGAGKVITAGTSGDDGLFKLNLPPKGEYKLKVSYIGYKDTTFALSVKDQVTDLNIGQIFLNADSQTLKAAVLTSKVPVIEQKLDKIVMNVSEAVATNGSTAMELLRRAPGVSLDPNGNIKLNGNSVQIWIDGRPSNLTGTDLEGMLSSTDGSMIDKIEVITRPSSKYDAAGSGGIINIRTKKNFLKGINGTVKAAYNMSHYDRYYHSGDFAMMMNYRSEKTSTTINYAPRYHQGMNRFNTSTLYNDGRAIYSHTNFDREIMVQNLSLTHDYFINKKTTVGFVLSNLWRTYYEMSDPTTGSEFYNSNSTLQHNVTTKIDNDFGFSNLSANAYLNHKFAKDKELTINADYYYYDMSRIAFQSNIYKDINGNESNIPVIFKNLSAQYINIKSIKADYEQPLWKNSKLETGAKYAKSTTDNNLDWLDMTSGTWVPNAPKSTDFIYHEDILAGYASVEHMFNEKFSIKGGLRAEYTNAKGEWISADTVTSKSYVDLFPTLYFNYNPNKNLRLGLAYSRRINRPNFEQVQPQSYFIDATSAAKGDPSIDPQYTDAVSLSLGVKKHINFTLMYDYTSKLISQIPSYDNVTGIKIITWANFGTMSNVSLNFSLSEFPITKWLYLSTNMRVYNNVTKRESYRGSQTAFSGDFSTMVLLPKNMKLEFSGWYESGNVYGYFKAKSQGEFNAGFKKGFFDNKALLSILVTDIFRTNINRVEMKDNVFDDYKFRSYYRSQRFNISFTYKFGQSKAYRRKNLNNTDEAARVSAGN